MKEQVHLNLLSRPQVFLLAPSEWETNFSCNYLKSRGTARMTFLSLPLLFSLIITLELISFFPFALYESRSDIVRARWLAGSLSNIIWSSLSNGATGTSAAVPPLNDAAKF